MEKKVCPYCQRSWEGEKRSCPYCHRLLPEQDESRPEPASGFDPPRQKNSWGVWFSIVLTVLLGIANVYAALVGTASWISFPLGLFMLAFGVVLIMMWRDNR